MKLKHLLPLILLLSLLSASCRQASIYSKKPVKKNKRIAGQTVPNDMVFIEGEGDLPSFYMSVSEEPNINYLVYLEWLKVVMGESYPEVYEAALPKQQPADRLYLFNDPYITSYMKHPALSYYPVTGLTWLQIQNYLQWKTDRMNEVIMIDQGILNWNTEQKDEDSFNTEVALFGQYEGDLRKLFRDEKTGRERNVKFEDGILLPGFRLPTEAEWEHASQAKFQKPIDRKRCLDPFSENAINHPYGQDYYPLRWASIYENGSEYWSQIWNRNWVDIVKLNSFRKKGFDYNPEEGDRAGIPQRLTSIGDYNPKRFGLVNMETNVREWLLDVYEESFDESEKDPLVILEKSGFPTRGAEVLDEKGEQVEKDMLGRMKHFRILGMDEKGAPLKVGNYKTAYYDVEKKGLLQNRKILTVRVAEIKGDTFRTMSQQMALLADIELYEFLIKENKTRKDHDKVRNHPQYYRFMTMMRDKESSKYLTDAYWEQSIRTCNLRLQNLDPIFLKNEIKKMDQTLMEIETYLTSHPYRKRLVKGGTWESPGKQRMALDERISDPQVGFRCVLPYTAQPVKRRYKMKWGR